MKKVAVVGATGYTGVELLRLLVNHPQVQVSQVTSRENAGTRVDAMFPNLRGFLDLDFTAPEVEQLAENDLVFFATPNGVAMKSTPTLLEAGVKVIDLAADFRIKDIDVWEKWYEMKHACPELVEEAVGQDVHARNGGQGVACRNGLFVVQQGQLAQTRLAQQAHVNGEGQGAQARVGADVRRRLVAADVLLARG